MPQIIRASPMPIPFFPNNLLIYRPFHNPQKACRTSLDFNSKQKSGYIQSIQSCHSCSIYLWDMIGICLEYEWNMIGMWLEYDIYIFYSSPSSSSSAASSSASSASSSRLLHRRTVDMLSKTAMLKARCPRGTVAPGSKRRSTQVGPSGG